MKRYGEAEPGFERAAFERLLSEVEIPRFAEVEYRVGCPVLEQVEESVRTALRRSTAFGTIKAGQTVAITAGSREIAHIVEILRTVSEEIKRLGAIPYLVPAMGSHGGADADGQKAILEGYGITEESTGAELRSSMEVVCLGKTEDGFDVWLDDCAMEADYIIPVGRIKAHTDFRGAVESGIVKMMVIGLGKQKGASICHKMGFDRMGQNLIRFAEVILRKAPILLGLGIVENARHETAYIEAVPAGRILKREPELLNYAKSLMARIPFDKIDVLVVSRMGKEISGAGMDPNVTGRSGTLAADVPHAEKIAVLDITEKSAGNSAGMGNADVITKRLYDKIDRFPVYVNAITCRDTAGAKTPVVMPTDDLALRFCLHTCVRRDAAQNGRIVWLRDTADLSRFWISEPLLLEAAKDERLTVTGEPGKVTFEDTMCSCTKESFIYP